MEKDLKQSFERTDAKKEIEKAKPLNYSSMDVAVYKIEGRNSKLP